jgi:hypothetical protein
MITQTESIHAWKLARHDRLPLLILISVWLFAAFLINPLGDFPLNDDWAYGLPVKWLVEQRKLDFTDWQFMTLIGQVVFGSLFALPAGFSFTILRVSTLFLGLTGVVSTYYLSRLAGGSHWISFLFALVLLCNPIYLLLSSTFMTDVPFFSASMLSIVLLTMAWRRNSLNLLILGWVAVAWSCSIRQTGLGIALGFTISALLNSGFRRRWIWAAILPSIVLLILLISYPKILETTIGLPSMYGIPIDMAKQALSDLLIRFRLGVLIHAARNIFLIFIYLGLSMLPCVVLLSKISMEGRRKITKKAGFRITILSAILISGMLFGSKWLMPMTQNTLIDFGLGIRTLLGSETLPKLPIQFWLLITTTGVFGACILFLSLIKIFQNFITNQAHYNFKNNSFLTIFLVVTLIIYNLPFILIYTPWFDRYIFLDIAILGVLFVHHLHQNLSMTTQRMMIAGLIIFVYLSFGIAGTHDYLEWNRQRWLALDQLTTVRGIAPELIDGGFEYNNYQPRMVGDQPRLPGQVNLVKSDVPYHLSFTQSPNYQVLERYPCRTWLWGAPQEIFVLFSPKT